MASIVAYIELRQGAITRPSRFVVAEARRVADAAGATVYALLTVGTLAPSEIDRYAAEISAAGADRILCSSSESLAGPPIDGTHGPLLAQIAERLQPVLYLFPAGGTGTELGCPLAVRVGAAYLANATIDVAAEERGPETVSERVVLTRWRAARDGQRRLDLGDLERPVVASLACGPCEAPLGEPYTEVEMLRCPEPGASPQLISCELDDATASETCSAMIWSASDLDAKAKAGLPAELPAGVAMVVAGGARAPDLENTSPRELFLLSPTGGDESPPLSMLAPGSTVIQVQAGTEVPR